jgi:O-antigen/teichoic acid export membrane protein
MIRQLIGHTAAYTFANLASRGTVLVWLIVLPAFLTVADYGVLGLIITTAALVSMLVPLEISQGLARYYPAAEPGDKRFFAATAWTFTLIMLAIAGGAALLWSRPLCGLLLGDLAYLTVFRIAIALFVLGTLFLFVQSQFRWEFRIRDYTLVTLAFAFVSLVLSIGFAATFADPLTGVLAGQIAGSAFGLALGLVLLRRSLGLGIDASKLRTMLRFSLPLVPASLAVFVSNFISRYILQDLLGLADVGLFTWASQIAAVPALLLLGVQAAVTPLVMKHHGEPETRVVLARTFEALVAAELCLCLAVGLLTPELIALLGYSGYAGAGPLVVILAPAYALLQLYVFAPGFAVRERTDLQLMVSLASAVVAVVGNYLLIGSFGLAGAAFATFAAAAAFLGTWLVLSQRLYPLPLRGYRLAAMVVMFGALAFAGLAGPPGTGLTTVAMKLALVAVLAVAAVILGLVRPSDLAMLAGQRKSGQGAAG